MEDYIFWSYSVLTVTRVMMECEKAGRNHPYSGGRTKASNIVMSKYQNKIFNISNLDRDDALAQMAAPICAHCGDTASAYQLDHLIPRSKIKNDYIGLNQVISCSRCNASRGNKDLMEWYRQNMSFPSLGVLRRYLKLCYFYAKQRGYLNLPVEEALLSGIPFDPRKFPEKFPPVKVLIWDYAYLGAQSRGP
ncbi:HNH endonuclease [Roseovarius dicentrarchi]|uniref:HNH endonuclease n=1 Tax=Roseovarius dicentrarchi TaxID=2250573 RepID=UPI000DE84E89|nr:HNH endonuclease [Roseovarius dicentrarchi]